MAKAEKTAEQYDREIALALAQRAVHKTPTLDDTAAWEALQADRKWFRVTSNKGNAKGLVGTEGQLAWISIEGDPKAWSSSPNRLKVSRVGLRVDGRSSYLFLNPLHVTLIPKPTSAEERTAIEVMSHGVSKAFHLRKKRRV